MKSIEEEISKPFKEIVKEKSGGVIITSDIARVTKREIRKAQKHYDKTGKCKHEIVYDVFGFVYDTRKCYICGKDRGTV